MTLFLWNNPLFGITVLALNNTIILCLGINILLVIGFDRDRCVAVLQVLLGEPETSSGLDEILTDVYLFLTKDGCIFLSRQLSGALYF